MGVADRTLKTFDYISKGLLPSDDARIRGDPGRTNTGLLFREETRGRQPVEKGPGTKGTRDRVRVGKETGRPTSRILSSLGRFARMINRILCLFIFLSLLVR